MTPFQYHFPYFFEIIKFNDELQPFQCIAHVSGPESKGDSDSLVIVNQAFQRERSNREGILQFPFGTFLMFQAERMYAWRRYGDGLLIMQFELKDEHPQETALSEFIKIGPLKPGRQHLHTKLHYDHFVTYIRKPNLTVKEDFHERYVILLLHKDQVTIIPFDSFNETGGDPLYMWPALATLDPATGMLYGHGMRMGSFEVQLDKAKLL